LGLAAEGGPPGPDHAFESGELSSAYIECAALNTNQLDYFFVETAITVLKGWLVIQVLAMSPQIIRKIRDIRMNSVRAGTVLPDRDKA